MTHQTDSVPSGTPGHFKRWFWRRPRAHVDTIRDVVILTALWAVAVRGFLLVGAWGEEPASAE
jgi:hypothetical protein